MPEMNYIALVQARVGCRDHVRYYADGTCPKCGRAAVCKLIVEELEKRSAK